MLESSLPEGSLPEDSLPEDSLPEDFVPWARGAVVTTAAFETMRNMEETRYSRASEASRWDRRIPWRRLTRVTPWSMVFEVTRHSPAIARVRIGVVFAVLLGGVPPTARAQPTAQGQPMAQGQPTAQGQWMPSPEGRYVWVPAGYELPEVMPYREGQPVPPGYHLEERPIRAALITGYVVTAVPYFTGLLIAGSSGFPNRSSFLVVPWAGPWLTLGLRENRCETETNEDESSDAGGCIGDALAGVALVFDGLIQAAGGTLVLVGYLAARTKLVRDTPAVSVTLRPMGAGYGISALGVF